jgi:hypothetical protein
MGPDFARFHCRKKKGLKMLGLPGNPCLPNVIDGYIAAALSDTTFTPKGPDQWGYIRSTRSLCLTMGWFAELNLLNVIAMKLLDG